MRETFKRVRRQLMSYIMNVRALDLFTPKLASVYFLKCAFLILRHCFIYPHHLFDT